MSRISSGWLSASGSPATKRRRPPCGGPADPPWSGRPAPGARSSARDAQFPDQSHARRRCGRRRASGRCDASPQHAGASTCCPDGAGGGVVRIARRWRGGSGRRWRRARRGGALDDTPAAGPDLGDRAEPLKMRAVEGSDRLPGRSRVRVIGVQHHQVAAGADGDLACAAAGRVGFGPGRRQPQAGADILGSRRRPSCVLGAPEAGGRTGPAQLPSAALVVTWLSEPMPNVHALRKTSALKSRRRGALPSVDRRRGPPAPARGPGPTAFRVGHGWRNQVQRLDIGALARSRLTGRAPEWAKKSSNFAGLFGRVDGSAERRQRPARRGSAPASPPAVECCIGVARFRSRRKSSVVLMNCRCPGFGGRPPLLWL